MKKVYKYTLPKRDIVDLLLPVGAKILHVAGQFDEICLWVLVDPDLPSDTRRRFHIYGTGHPIPENRALHYLGTAHLHEGYLVFHIFEDMV